MFITKKWYLSLLILKKIENSKFLFQINILYKFTYFTNSTRVYNWVEVSPVPQIIADLHFRFKNTPKETVRE